MPKPGSKAWRKSVAKMLIDELEQPMRWHYCSFANDKFLGALFIEGCGITDISIKTWMLGINPGGEMMCIELPKDANIPTEQYRNRLLTRKELEEAAGPVMRVNSNLEPQDVN